MNTFITFINIKQVQYPGAHCTALSLNNAYTLNNLNAVIVKCSWKLVSSELKHHKKTIMHAIKK